MDQLLLKIDLARIVAKETGLTIKSSKMAVDAFVESMLEELSGGGEIRLQGFARLFTKILKPRLSFNVKTRERFTTKEKTLVKAKISRRLLLELNTDK